MKAFYRLSTVPTYVALGVYLVTGAPVAGAAAAALVGARIVALGSILWSERAQ